MSGILPASAADHSLHVLAHVAPRCTVHRATSHVELAVATGDEATAGRSLRGGGGFRIACNVPYAFDFRLVRRHRHIGRLSPIAALAAADVAALAEPALLELTVSLPGRDGPLEGHCNAGELSPAAQACTPISAPDDPRLGMPRGDVRLALAAAIAPDTAADASPAGASAAAVPDAEFGDGASRLVVAVQPRH